MLPFHLYHTVSILLCVLGLVLMSGRVGHVFVLLLRCDDRYTGLCYCNLMSYSHVCLVSGHQNENIGLYVAIAHKYCM